MPRRCAALALVVTAACAAPLGPLGTGPVHGPDATATDVVAALAVTHDAPTTAVAIAAVSRWGSLAALGELRRFGLFDGQLALVADSRVRAAPRDVPGLAAIADGAPRVVRVIRAAPAPAEWFLTVSAIEPAAPDLDVAAALDDALARWTVYATASAPALERALHTADRDTPGQPLVATPIDQRLELFVPSWDGDHLTVTYAIHRAQRTEVWQHHSAGSCGKYRMPGPDGGPPEKAPCQPRPASASVLRRGYAADVALVLTYDRRGVLVRERRFAPRAAPGPAPKLESAG